MLGGGLHFCLRHYSDYDIYEGGLVLSKDYWETALKQLHMPLICFGEIKSRSSYSLTWSNWAAFPFKNHHWSVHPSVNICNPAFRFVATEFQMQSSSQKSVAQNLYLCPSLCSVDMSIQQHLSLPLQEHSEVAWPFRVHSTLQALVKQLFHCPNPNRPQVWRIPAPACVS